MYEAALNNLEPSIARRHQVAEHPYGMDFGRNECRPKSRRKEIGQDILIAAFNVDLYIVGFTMSADQFRQATSINLLDPKRRGVGRWRNSAAELVVRVVDKEVDGSPIVVDDCKINDRQAGLGQ